MTKFSHQLVFLAGAGEMAQRIRDHDWVNTPLGTPDSWPRALLGAAYIMQNTRQPASIFWGPDAICLYNDAFHKSVGNAHAPALLGLPARRALANIWPVVGPQIDHVMRGGDGAYGKDQLIDLPQDGHKDRVFWSPSYSPILDDDAACIGGVLMICTDITESVLAQRKLARETQNRYSLFQRLTTFVCILCGPEHIYEYANDAYMTFSGKRALIGRPVRDVFPELHEQGFFELLDGVYATGEPVALHVMRIQHADEDYERFVDLRYDPTYDDNGKVDGIFVSGHEITDQVRAETRRAALAELSSLLHELPTAPAIVGAASRLLGRTMNVERAGYATIDETETCLLDQDWNAPGVEPLPARINLRDYGSFIGDLKLGAVVAISDCSLDDRTKRFGEAFESQGIRSFACVPVIEQGVLVAEVYLTNGQIRKWSDDDIAFLCEYSQRVRTAVERCRGDESLHLLAATLEDKVEERTRERDRLWETSEDLLAVFGFDGETFRVSPSWKRLLGHEEKMLLTGSYMDIIHPDEANIVLAMLEQLLATNRPVRFQNRVMASDGTWRWIAWSLVPEADTRRFFAVGRDITAERRAAENHAVVEEQLRQSQKMEAVGQLTGGIAHDFNNILQGITGSLQLAIRRHSQGRMGEITLYLDSALTAAYSAASLTHRLLAFSRRQPLDPRPVDANVLLTSLAELFDRTLGERIDLKLILADDLWITLCDPNQLESSMLNLVLNARDAMPGGGTLTIETRNVEHDRPYLGDLADLLPGNYMCVSVTDNGVGMTAETAAQAFDPFFTTKPVGSGTGLGLSMAYGFARQSEGFARLHSTFGEGTSMTICLPQYVAKTDATLSDTAPALAIEQGHGESILVIEDNATVRKVVVEALTDLGYRTFEAEDGYKGLAFLQSDVHLDLLLTDIGLPGIDGRQVAQAARLDHPDLRILLMTGYAEKATMASGFLDAGMEMITKPFTLEDFTSKIREMIDA